MSEKGNSKTVWAPCASCGNENRRHSVLFEKVFQFGDEYGQDHDEHHLFLQCMGCDSIRYKQFSTSQYKRDEFGHEEPFDISIFPSPTSSDNRQPLHFADPKVSRALVPENVLKMYLETIIAFNADAKTLAGGGLRATVEAICIAEGLISGTLQQKIDDLANRSLLTSAQADLLHEERYIGNSALHELATPSKEDVEDGLQIVEGLMTTLYVLPIKAERLKKRRAKASKKKPPKKSGRTKK